MSTVKRKYCKLHGWAPHVIYLMVTKVDFDTKEVTAEFVRECCRCNPPREQTIGKILLAKLRGFKLHGSTTAKVYLASKTKPETV